MTQEESLLDYPTTAGYSTTLCLIYDMRNTTRQLNIWYERFFFDKVEYRGEVYMGTARKVESMWFVQRVKDRLCDN